MLNGVTLCSLPALLLHIICLHTQLDQVQNPGLSKLDVQTLLERRRKQNRDKKAKKKKSKALDVEDENNP